MNSIRFCFCALILFYLRIFFSPVCIRFIVMPGKKKTTMTRNSSGIKVWPSTGRNKKRNFKKCFVGNLRPVRWTSTQNRRFASAKYKNSSGFEIATRFHGLRVPKLCHQTGKKAQHSDHLSQVLQISDGGKYRSNGATIIKLLRRKLMGQLYVWFAVFWKNERSIWNVSHVHRCW